MVHGEQRGEAGGDARGDGDLHRAASSGADHVSTTWVPDRAPCRWSRCPGGRDALQDRATDAESLVRDRVRVEARAVVTDLDPDHAVGWSMVTTPGRRRPGVLDTVHAACTAAEPNVSATTAGTVSEDGAPGRTVTGAASPVTASVIPVAQLGHGHRRASPGASAAAAR